MGWFLLSQRDTLRCLSPGHLAAFPRHSGQITMRAPFTAIPFYIFGPSERKSSGRRSWGGCEAISVARAEITWSVGGREGLREFGLLIRAMSLEEIFATLRKLVLEGRSRLLWMLGKVDLSSGSCGAVQVSTGVGSGFVRVSGPEEEHKDASRSDELSSRCTSHETTQLTETGEFGLAN
jgi:hypothetical protein